MQVDLSGGPGLAIVAGDVLALRGTGLAAAETWALLCQAAQALQDLFLSNGGVVGGSRAGPVVTPHTLELTPRGRVLLQLAPPETARAYLPPEYRPGRVYSDTDSEKMWMYSLGRALLDTTPRVAALTGTVSVSPSSALQSVLAAMTEPDPRRRASLMNLLDVISEYCRTRLQSKPFTHIVMDMYREVVKSPQYAARKRIIYQHLNPPPPLRNPSERPEQNRYQSNYAHHHHQQAPQPIDHLQSVYGQTTNHQHPNRPYHAPNQFNPPRQNPPDQVHRPPNQFHHLHHQQLPEPAQHPQIPKAHHYHHHHPAKGALFKLQSRNSHSHPNLTSLCGQQSQQGRRQEANPDDRRTQFQSQLNVQVSGRPVGPAIHHQRRHHHSRTYSQPIYTRLQHTRSSGNLPSTVVGENNSGGNVYSDPIYALPVKPFLSSQDVRVNGLSVKPSAQHRNEDVYTGAAAIARRPSTAGYSHPDIATSSTDRAREEVYGKSAGCGNPALQRQHSNPQLPSRDQQEEDFKRLPEQNVAATDHRYPAARRKEEQMVQQQNPVSSIRTRSVQGPPKPPRIITTLKKAPFSDAESSKSEPPAKPPRNLVKNGPRARRGKAVQRAPSRLYRTVGGPMRSFNKAQCIGPEFVVRANQPPKTLCVGQIKTGNSGRIVVIMLTGQRVEVTCDPQKVTAGDLFQAIVQAESLDENFTLGLAVLLAGDFAILPPDTKLNKVAPPGWLSSGKSKGLLGLPTSFMLYLRLRFFLPSLRGIRSWISKHLLYLQIRRCVLEQQLVCPYAELINLTGLALQAEFGNYNVNEHGCGDYFLLEHYIPESFILNIDQHQSQIPSGGTDALRARLHQAHRDRRGLDSNKAEEMFITHAQTLPDYGSHYYIATMDSKELEKVMAQQKKRKASDDHQDGSVDATKHIYGHERAQEYPIRSRIELARLGSCENIPKIPYAEERRPGLTRSATSNEIYTTQKSKCRAEVCNNNNNNVNNNNNINHSGKSGKEKNAKKKTESNVWLAIHAQGLKLFERGGEPRERTELAQFQWKDIQTLSYSKSCLVVYSKVNGKRCKFKLRMDHRKSYFAFKLTSLHHQFFLRLRSELTSLQGLAKDFGVPTTMETKASPSKTKSHDSKTKIAIANTVKNAQLRQNYPMQLEEYQNKENENPQRDVNVVPKPKDPLREPGLYSSEEDALYAQVNVRLEPEGESRDTEDESERSLTTPNEPISLDPKGIKSDAKIYNCPRIDLEAETECGYSLPKIMSSNDVDQLEKPDNPEELYAAINKVGISRKNEFPVPEEVWDVSDVKKSLHKMKTSSLPNYGTSRQSGGYRTPSLPRRLGVKMGTRAIYSSLVQKDTALTDDMESLSLKSDTESSIQSLSARSTESPLPEAYVLNADIRTDDETFHLPEDESMSVSLAARLEELSFAEERILQTIKLERGHGGSIGLQVTEGNDGGVYVQAVSVGGSADMSGNVNKGDRIVAINGQNLLHLRYEEALKMLQSSSETIELVLSQATSRKNATSRPNREQGVAENNYISDIRFDVSSEADTSSMTNKWLVQRTTDVASVQNTSSAYSSAASSAMGAEFGSRPPVPPRRKKRKAKPAPIIKSTQDSSPMSFKKPDRKRLAPPPPPPRTARKVKSCTSKAEGDQTISSDQGIEDEEENLNSLSSVDTVETHQPSSLQFDDTDLIPTKETSTNEAQTTEPPSQQPFPLFDPLSRKQPNKYPPLFFTLHDFQNVMSSSLQFEGDSRTTSSFEPAGFFREVSLEHSLDDEENEVCFRVTTTNLPFEKSLDGWTTNFADEFVEKYDESSRFIFDDYMDRSNRVNVRRSAGPMCYENFEEDPVVPRPTKVRFVIESPSTSTPDNELNEDGEDTSDSLQNIEPLEDDDAGRNFTSVRLTEIFEEEDLANDADPGSQNSDEFGDVPFSSVLKAGNDSGEWSSLENASTFIDPGDKEDDGTRADSSQSFHTSIALDSRNESFHSTWTAETVDVVDTSEAESSLTEREPEFAFKYGSMWNIVRDDGLRRLMQSINCTGTKIESGDEGLPNEICMNTNNNIDESEEITLQDADDVRSEATEDESTLNEENGNCFEQESIGSEQNLNFTERQQSVNEVRNEILDEVLITNGTEKKSIQQDLIPVGLTSENGTEVFVTKETVGSDDQQDETNKFSLEYKRKIFVNDSLRNFMNRPDFESQDSEEQDFKEESVGYETSLSKVQVNFEETSATTDVDESEKVLVPGNSEKKICVPVDVRRNSFLENILSEDSNEVWLVSPSCEVVAAHLKSNPAKKEENNFSNRLNDSIRSDLEIQKILKESSASSEKVDTFRKSVAPKKVIEPSKKNAGEVKCDVLNELLSNFSNIKLKPVSSDGRAGAEECSPVTSASRRDDDEERTGSRSKASPKNDKHNSRDETYDEIVNLNATISFPGQRYDDNQTPRRVSIGHDENDQRPTFDRRRQSLEEPEITGSGLSIGTLTKLKLIRRNLPNLGSNYGKRLLKVDVHRSEDDECPLDIARSITADVRVESDSSKVSAACLKDESSGSSLEPPRIKGCGEKTEAKVLEDRGHEADGDPRDRGAIVRRLELKETAGSGDKCAITRRNPRPHCNNNDNNRAVTPVAVSNDQSRDTVTITPGRVRSFVKYYEIRREATTDRDSKANDRDKVDRDEMTGHQSVFSIRRGLEARAVEARSSDAWRDNFQTTIVDKSSETTRRREDKSSAIPGTRGIENSSLIEAKDYVEQRKIGVGIGKPSVAEARAQSGKVKRKKSVKFQGGYTVIGARSPDEHGSSGSPANQDAKSPGKRKAPKRPATERTVFTGTVDLEATEPEVFVDADSCSFEKRETAAQMQAATECEECSGINRFVPKPETPRLVFYCTV